MGTSTWHRSPATPEWNLVRELYAQPDPSPREVVSRIVGALDPATRAGMSDPAVVTCLGVLVTGTQQVASDGLAPVLSALGVQQEPAAIRVAAGLRARAEHLIAEQQCASRFGDLALEALGTTSLALASLQAEGAGLLEIPLVAVEASLKSLVQHNELHEVAETFVGHELDRTFRHFVSRDLEDFVGGAGVPTVAHANRLEDAVALCCREGCASVELGEYEDMLAQASRLDAAARVQELAPVLRAGIAQGLSMLGGGD